jgi:hypothetical protein
MVFHFIYQKQERGAYGPFEFVLFIRSTTDRLVIWSSPEDFSSEPFFQDHPDKNGIGDGDELLCRLGSSFSFFSSGLTGEMN